jgi:hypothetical protein
MRRYCIAYHLPYPTSVYAPQYVYRGFRNAFLDLGHEFVTFSPGVRLSAFLAEHEPDVFITASHFLYRKYLDYELLRRYRRKGMLLLTKVDFWDSPIHSRRVNEAPSMKDDSALKALLKQGLLGDRFFSTTAQGDARMDGFAAFANSNYITIPLAADSITLQPRREPRFEADISFIGTYLPQKRALFDELVFPLRPAYDLRLYGQDWTRRERALGVVTKVGQYFNIPMLRSLQKAALEPGDEGSIYASSKVLINIHEDYQRRFGGDCNERTFKIPFCAGLEICDDVAVVSDYFADGREIIVARSRDDWFDKIRYYLEHEDAARSIGTAGRERALREHTYHHRAKQVLDLL